MITRWLLRRAVVRSSHVAGAKTEPSRRSRWRRADSSGVRFDGRCSGRRELSRHIFTAVNDHQFLVIERNGGTATSGTPYKRIFLIDLDRVSADGFVLKTDIVDLMNLVDAHDLNGDGQTVFTFPYVTIESVLILDSRTLLVINDNNFPGGGGRSVAPDQTEFLRIKVDQPLDLRDHSARGGDEDDD